MNVLEFLASLAENNIAVIESEGKLKIKAPKGALNDDHKSYIRENKNEILRLLQKNSDLAHNESITIPPVERSVNEYPLTLLQTSMWYTHMLNANNSTYNIPVLNELKGQLDSDLLIKCIETVYQRHEGLRAHFIEVDFEPKQSIRCGEKLNLQLEPINESDIAETFRQECDFQFDLEFDSLFRVRLFIVSPTYHLLLLNMHHIISDGRSVSLILSEISELYKHNGDCMCLPDQALHYVDFAIWQEERVNSPDYLDAKRYWLHYLKAAPTQSVFAPDVIVPSVEASPAGEVWFRVNTEVKLGLVELANKHQCTLYVVMLACFKILLYRSTQQSDLLIGTMSQNRRSTELSNIVGYFANPLVIRTQISTPLSIDDMIKQIKHNVEQSMRYQEVPFIDIATSLKLKRGGGNSLLFQILFLFSHSNNGELDLADVESRYVEQDVIHAKYDLTVDLMEKSEGHLRGVFTYNTALYKEETIQSLVKEYTQLIESIALG